MAVILLCLSAATTAHAQDYPPDIVGIEVSEDVVKPGDKVEVRVPGFCPQSSVAVYLVPAGKARSARRGRRLRQVRIATRRADRNGVVNTTVRVPANTAPGRYTLELRGRSADCKTARLGSATIRVLGSNAAGGSPGDPGSSPAIAGDSDGAGEAPEADGTTAPAGRVGSGGASEADRTPEADRTTGADGTTRSDGTTAAEGSGGTSEQPADAQGPVRSTGLRWWLLLLLAAALAAWFLERRRSAAARLSPGGRETAEQ